ncbi:MAG: RagB/SusD family nutrient uptake outer membrane protein [Prevotellaceae bacterium]|nr:RagB/SusD family nutrient uptake outer membrane protein [Prevotellaceae bacterium]
MKKIKYSLKTVALLSVLITGSCNFLDVNDYFEDTIQIDSVFTNKVYLEQYLWGAAALLPDEDNIFANSYYPAILGSDEGFTMWESDYIPQRFPIDEITSSDMGSMNIWESMYQIIRKANTIFARINECEALSAQERREIVGYAHFLRGYAYYHLLLNYGPLLIVGDDIYETSLGSEAYQKSRSTYGESVEYVCNELETAASYIPPIVPVNVFGRPTKGAAYGLIARVRVYAASPLYNGGQAARTYFSNFRRKSDNVNYVSQTYDETKWAIAAAACKRVMDMGYELHTVESAYNTPKLPEGITHDPDYYKSWPEGAANIDPLRSYSEMFNGETLGFKNTEYVFGKNSAEVRDRTKNSFPATFGGWNGHCIPQKIIDTYKMTDGREIDNFSDKYPYREDGFTVRDSTFSGYTIKQNVNLMYTNREARFYASVGFSGCLWTMNSTTETGKFMQQAFYSIDGNSGKSASTEGDARNYPITGYVLKKYIHPDDAFSGANAALLDKSFPIVRLADILLMYAECLNNLTQSHTVPTGNADGDVYTFSRNTEEMAAAFNKVRHRSGLPGLTPEELSSPESFFEALKKERMIEFLHEGLRYYDVRRWGIVADEEAIPVMGMNTEQTERNGYYNRVICNYTTVRNRVFKPKMILLPIDLQEIKRVQTLDQNPGW